MVTKGGDGWALQGYVVGELREFEAALNSVRILRIYDALWDHRVPIVPTYRLPRSSSEEHNYHDGAILNQRYRCGPQW